MCEEIILVRNGPNDPWGFRLTGGKNFGTPLTVVKITGGGIAESAGMQVGDMVMKISDEDTTNFSHSDAQKAIINAGDTLILSVLRGSPVELPITPLRGMTPVSRPQSTITVTLDHVENLLDPNIVPTDADVVLVKNSVANLDAPVNKPYPKPPKEKDEPTEEEIAELMLENAEVIDDYNVIGVNFQRFVPKCDFIKNSLVFQALQEEAIRKEKTEEEQLSKCPDKRFSTFLVHPNRPKPVIKILLKDSAKKEESQSEKLNIEAKSTLETETNEATPEEKTNEEPSKDEDNNLPTINVDSGETEEDLKQATEELVTALENIIDGNVKDEDEEEKNTKYSNQPGEQNEVQEKQTNLNNISAELSDFDKQLLQIQNQLASISMLPNTIQSHLQQVQEQINKLLELKSMKSKTDSVPEGEVNEAERNDLSEVQDLEINEEVKEEYPQDSAQDLNANQNQNEEVEDQAEEINPEDELNLQPEDEPPRRKKWSIPRVKPSFPLTPLLRPIVLPGGRKWKTPKDAYSEALITETLVSQAEVLVGTTIGVNFRKYEPAKIDMSHSPVWRLIHGVEEPRGGIANRPEKVRADCEYMEPIHARHFHVANLTINPDVVASLTGQGQPVEGSA